MKVNIQGRRVYKRAPVAFPILIIHLYIEVDIFLKLDSHFLIIIAETT